MPLSQVRSMRAGAGMSLWMSYSARGGQRALVVDEPGEQAAALAFDLRVDAPSRRGRADDRVGLIMAELAARAHAFGTFGDRHAHPDARPLRPASLRPRAMSFAPRQVPPEVQCLLRFHVDPLVEAFVADGGLVVADPQGDLTDPEPVTVPQLVDPDIFLCRQVGISFHDECNAFSSVMNLNTSNRRQALHFYLEPGVSVAVRPRRYDCPYG